jgi:hypothetical protein
MTTHEHSVELAGVNLAGRNHVCAFFNTIDEEHRVLGSFYKDGLDRGEKPAHIVDPENREELRPRSGLHRSNRSKIQWLAGVVCA